MRISCILIFMFVCLIRIQAQPEKGQYEISGSAGFISNISLINIFNASNIATPGIFVTGKYFIADRIALGGTLGFQLLNGTSSSMEFSNTFKEADFTYAIEATFIYIRKSSFDMYGLFGIGGNPYLRHTSDIEYSVGGSSDMITNSAAFRPAGQFTPLGFRFGKSVAGFLELGFGYKGILNGGVAFTLGQSHVQKKLIGG